MSKPHASIPRGPELDAFLRVADQLLPVARNDDERVAAGVIWYLVRLARLAEQRLEFGVHRPLGWTWAGFRVMFNTYVLGVAEPSQLAEILGVSRPSATSTLDKLERDGFLIRRPDPQNHARVQVRLTAKGRTAVETAVPLQNSLEVTMLSGMAPADRRALLALLQRLFLSTDAEAV